MHAGHHCGPPSPSPQSELKGGPGTALATPGQHRMNPGGSAAGKERGRAAPRSSPAVSCGFGPVLHPWAHECAKPRTDDATRGEMRAGSRRVGSAAAPGQSEQRTQRAGRSGRTVIGGGPVIGGRWGPVPNRHWPRPRALAFAPPLTTEPEPPPCTRRNVCAAAARPGPACTSGPLSREPLAAHLSPVTKLPRQAVRSGGPGLRHRASVDRGGAGPPLIVPAIWLSQPAVKTRPCVPSLPEFLKPLRPWTPPGHAGTSPC
ncbi:uncharacterized protein LOC134473272 isoform X2 [Cavia porcellus]|uniref:uncharacterized protein LOC134473272 isoform X2 n=1 Tax=Cavia porcellus TaxID=10141 RepID=UPI002FE22634